MSKTVELARHLETLRINNMYKTDFYWTWDKTDEELEAIFTVADALRDKILVIGENLSIRRFLRYEGDCVAYVHGGGRIGVLVRFDADGRIRFLREFGCNADRYDPYANGPVPVFRYEKVRWF